MKTARILQLCSVILLATLHLGASQRIVVKYNDSVESEQIQTFEKKFQLKLHKELKLLHARVYLIPDTDDSALDKLLGEIGKEACVKYAETDKERRLNTISFERVNEFGIIDPEGEYEVVSSSEPEFVKQYYLHNTGQWINGTQGPVDYDIDWPEAMLLYEPQEVVKVAVIDSGIALLHPDLRENVAFKESEFHWDENTDELSWNNLDDDGNGYIDDWYGWDFYDGDFLPEDGNGHGTMVASIIAGNSFNEGGIEGINTFASVLPLRIFDYHGNSSQTFSSDFAEALIYAKNEGCFIVNASLGGSHSSLLEYEAINVLDAAGILIVAACGNGGTDGIGDNIDFEPVYPASYPQDNIISVASINRFNNLSSFSNWGLFDVDFAVYGEDIRGSDVDSDVFYSEDFENGSEGWSDGWTAANQSTNRWITYSYFNEYTNQDNTVLSDNIPSETYAPFTDTFAMTPEIDLTDLIYTRLRFDIIYQLYWDWWDSDLLLVEVTTDDGLTWSIQDAVWGEIPNLYDRVLFERFRTIQVDLTRFQGEKIKIRFRLKTGLNTGGVGVAIDNIQLLAVDPLEVEAFTQQYNNGTSFSAPIVSGIASLMKAQRPDLTHYEIKQLLMESVVRVPDKLGGKIRVGGVVNAYQALWAAMLFQRESGQSGLSISGDGIEGRTLTLSMGNYTGEFFNLQCYLGADGSGYFISEDLGLSSTDLGYLYYQRSENHSELVLGYGAETYMVLRMDFESNLGGSLDGASTDKGDLFGSFLFSE